MEDISPIRAQTIPEWQEQFIFGIFILTSFLLFQAQPPYGHLMVITWQL